MAHAGFMLVALAFLLLGAHTPAMLFSEIRGSAFSPEMKNREGLSITLGEHEPGRAAVPRGPDARQRVPTRFMGSILQ